MWSAISEGVVLFKTHSTGISAIGAASRIVRRWLARIWPDDIDGVVRVRLIAAPDVSKLAEEDRDALFNDKDRRNVL
jgi:hypothetical protein